MPALPLLHTPEMPATSTDVVREITVIIPTPGWSGTFERCGRRTLELVEGTSCEAELVVALDGAPAEVPAWLDHPKVRVVSTGVNSGPAAARNRAAAVAGGSVLLFVDADVELADDVIDLVRRRFEAEPDLAALVGTYDDEPAADGTISQFRNLLHHHTHVAHSGPVDTFWAGCGAIRAANFRSAGGFDETYRFPCVEDVELGVRLSQAGARIELDPSLRCKHHKDWTLRSMVFTDVARRATPWTRMVLRTGVLSLKLATDWRNRASGVLTVAATALLAGALLAPILCAPAAACLAGVLCLNLRFYRTSARKRGLPFAIAAYLLHLLFFLYSSVTFGIVFLHGRLFARAQDRPGAAAGCRRGPAPSSAAAAEPMQATCRE